jgi:hypothetical protein
MNGLPNPQRAALGLLLWAGLLPGCLGSEIQRHVLDLPRMEGWSGQPGRAEPDSMVAARVPVSSRIPAFADGSASGVEEVALFIQLQNRSTEFVDVRVYGHPSRVFDIPELRRSGLAVTAAIALDPVSSVQIDARNYPRYGANFDGFADLIRGGEFYLYVVADTDTFDVAGNVPSLSLLVTVDD